MGIDENDAEFEFSKVGTRMDGLTDNGNIMLHNACHLSFRSHIARKEIKYKTHDAIHEDQQTENPEYQKQSKMHSIEISNFRRSKRKSGGEMKRICFVCNEMKEIDCTIQFRWFR